ncbi:MAG TPA: FAD binding domain-containing protein [Elusimicrobiota bacterium]|nr:FAD binding domain-containing protein [Elusimicrobiota bacterium]
MLNFIINQQPVQTDEPRGMVLLDFIRDVKCLSGTKEACREGECGACTVLIGTPRPDGSVSYKACASCLLPIGDVDGCHVVTVEGLSADDTLTLVQQSIVDHSASQCGFCTPGIVLSLTAFCLTSPDYSYEDALNALDGNICRCTGYVSIRNAARALCDRLAKTERAPEKRVAALISAGVIPAYFNAIPQSLKRLPGPSSPPCGDAVLVAGGTDLFVQKPEALRESELCFLSQRRDLDYIREEKDGLHVGGAVTIEDFRLSAEVSRHFPSLKNDLLLHSSTVLRNKATITGNIVNASPIGDMSIILLALEARLAITAKDGSRRETPLSTFYKGYKQYDLACGEIIHEIFIPFLPRGARFNFEKVSNRVYLDIAAVNTALRLTVSPDGKITDLRLSAGGVAPFPLLIGGLDRFCGTAANAATGAEIAKTVTASVKPIDDIRGTAAYKKLLLNQLVIAHFAGPSAPGTSR